MSTAETTCKKQLILRMQHAPCMDFRAVTSSAAALPVMGNSCWALCTAPTHQDPSSTCMWPKPRPLQKPQPWRLWNWCSCLTEGRQDQHLTKKKDSLKAYIIASGFCLLCSAIALYSVVVLAKQHPIARKHTYLVLTLHCSCSCGNEFYISIAQIAEQPTKVGSKNKLFQ